LWAISTGRDNTLEAPEDRVRRKTVAWQHLLALSDTVDRATSVDGCVVLTRKLQLLGFGGEIRVPTEHSLDEDRHTGTRHRSAARFCKKFPGAIALVVSQDGQVSIFCTDQKTNYCRTDLAAADSYEYL